MLSIVYMTVNAQYSPPTPLNSSAMCIGSCRLSGILATYKATLVIPRYFSSSVFWTPLSQTPCDVNSRQRRHRPDMTRRLWRHRARQPEIKCTRRRVALQIRKLLVLVHSVDRPTACFTQPPPQDDLRTRRRTTTCKAPATKTICGPHCLSKISKQVA